MLNHFFPPFKIVCPYGAILEVHRGNHILFFNPYALALEKLVSLTL